MWDTNQIRNLGLIENSSIIPAGYCCKFKFSFPAITEFHRTLKRPVHPV